MDKVEIDLMYSIFGLTDCKNIIINSGTESMEYLLVISHPCTDVMFETRCIVENTYATYPALFVKQTPYVGGGSRVLFEISASIWDL